MTKAFWQLSRASRSCYFFSSSSQVSPIAITYLEFQILRVFITQDFPKWR